MDTVQEAIYRACRQAAAQMGPEIKQLSWFGHHRSAANTPRLASELVADLEADLAGVADPAESARQKILVEEYRRYI